MNNDLSLTNKDMIQKLSKIEDFIISGLSLRQQYRERMYYILGLLDEVKNEKTVKLLLTLQTLIKKYWSNKWQQKTQLKQKDQ